VGSARSAPPPPPPPPPRPAAFGSGAASASALAPASTNRDHSPPMRTEDEEDPAGGFVSPSPSSSESGTPPRHGQGDSSPDQEAFPLQDGDDVPFTPAQQKRMALLLEEDRDAVARVVRLQAELERTRANIRSMETRLQSTTQEELQVRSKGDEAVSQAMSAVTAAQGFLTGDAAAAAAAEGSTGAGTRAVIGGGMVALDAATAEKMRTWYQAEIDRLSHHVARLESDLQERDDAVIDLRRQLRETLQEQETTRATLELKLKRGKFAMEEKLEEVQSSHRRAVAATEDRARQNLDELRATSKMEAQRLVRRTRAVVKTERIIRLLYNRKMFQAWATWMRYSFHQSRKQDKLRSVLVRMRDVKLHTAWLRWREYLLNLTVKAERLNTGLARKQTANFQQLRACEKLMGAWRLMERRRLNRGFAEWKRYVSELNLQDQRIRTHGSLMRRYLRRLVNSKVRGCCRRGGGVWQAHRSRLLHAPVCAPVSPVLLRACLVRGSHEVQLLAAVNRWKVFVVNCKQAELGQRIHLMEDQVDEARRNAERRLEEAAAKVRCKGRHTKFCCYCCSFLCLSCVCSMWYGPSLHATTACCTFLLLTTGGGRNAAP